MRWWWCPRCSRPTRWVDFDCANSLKQQSMDRHVALLGHIILIPKQPVFALSPQCCVFSENNKCQVYCLWFDPTGARNPRHTAYISLLITDVRYYKCTQHIFSKVAENIWHISKAIYIYLYNNTKWFMCDIKSYVKFITIYGRFGKHAV